MMKKTTNSSPAHGNRAGTSRLSGFSRAGVTLVEMLIAFLILGIVLGLGYIFLNRTFISMDRQRQSLDTLHEARDFLGNVERDLREMTRLVALDTVFKSNLYDEENALFFSMVLEVPDRQAGALTTVTYSYEGPSDYKDKPNSQKIIYRQEKGKVKKALISKQLNYIKIWGTDGTIFRNREVGEAIDTYRDYLAPHYYNPTNPFANGLKDLARVKGVQVRLCMHEMLDNKGESIKIRTFDTRIYSRVLNSKYE